MICKTSWASKDLHERVNDCCNKNIDLILCLPFIVNKGTKAILTTMYEQDLKCESQEIRGREVMLQINQWKMCRKKTCTKGTSRISY